MSAHGRNRTLVIQSREVTQDPIYGTSVTTWTDVATVMARVQDVLPGRGERLDDGINIGNRPARIWILFRDGLTSAMRFIVKGRGPDEADRVMRIISGPAEVENSGFRGELQFLAEDLTTSGDEA